MWDKSSVLLSASRQLLLWAWSLQFSTEGSRLSREEDSVVFGPLPHNSDDVLNLGVS